MKQIRPQTPIFSMIVPKQIYAESKKYRMSKYSVCIEYKNKVLLFNTLTREMLVLEKDEYFNIENNKLLLKELVEKYFWVEDSFDEKKLFDQVLSVAKTLNKQDAITNFVIFPTMDCNARCFYCFEHGANRYPMSEKTAYDVADFIIKKSNGKKINIQWFGGEPLCNVKVIDIISNRLKESGVEFKSKMISNGYLFDEETALHSKKAWNMNLIQITLDGTREVYNRIKNYIYKPNTDAFDKVINNIETALKNDVRVLIRLNIDKYNSEDIFELTEFLCEKFKGFENKLSIYLWMLYDERGAVKKVKTTEERWALTNQLLEIEDYIYKQGFGLRGGPRKDITTNMCLADSDKTLTILPNGKVGKCDHHSEDKLIGNIYNDDFDIKTIAMWKELRGEVELCDQCPLYPECVKLKNCPELGNYDCDVIEQKRLLEKLYHQMRYAYDKYTNNLK